MDADTADRTVGWIEDDCLDRLAQAPTVGLAEAVLVASIRHRAPRELGPVTGATVRRVLKTLETSGRVKHSAGRWRLLR